MSNLQDWKPYDYRVKPVEAKPPLRVMVQFLDTSCGRMPAGASFGAVADARHQVEFIELTPEIRAKLGIS